MSQYVPMRGTILTENMTPEERADKKQIDAYLEKANPDLAHQKRMQMITTMTMIFIGLGLFLKR